jgi:hypothetical protein
MLTAPRQKTLTPPRILNACHATGALLVEACDIPEDMTLTEWRREHEAARPPKPSLLRRLRGAH